MTMKINLTFVPRGDNIIASLAATVITTANSSGIRC